MRIVIGRGTHRRVFEIGHPASCSKVDREQQIEDLTAYLFRPATFGVGR